MKYITSMRISMPAKTNLEKAKAEFSFLGEPKDIYREIYEFTGFKIEDAFNESIFLEEFNETVNLKLDLYFLDCAFIFIKLCIDSKTSLDIKVLNENSFLFNKRKELSKLKIDSIGDIYDKLILSKYYNLKSFANILDNIDLDMNHAERWNEFIKSDFVLAQIAGYWLNVTKPEQFNNGPPCVIKMERLCSVDTNGDDILELNQARLGKKNRRLMARNWFYER